MWDMRLESVAWGVEYILCVNLSRGNYSCISMIVHECGCMFNAYIL